MMKWLLLVVLTSLSTHCVADDFSSELPRIPATEPQGTLANFTTADGFRIELVASEPLIASPVAIEWDGQGRMFVCEMRGYSENQDDKISSIALLEDTDQDGVYDLRHDYATGLNWPTAIFPFDGGLFVGDAPHLLYLKDTDGDGRSDQRKVVLTGFGTSNVQGLMNSFRWGLDNRIHIACSSTGGSIAKVFDDGTGKVSGIRGRDLSFDPRTYDFRKTSGAAQHGMCFDDWGRKFVSSNSDHIQQVMYDDHYVGRNRYFSPPPARISIAADGPQAEVFRTSPVEPWRIVRTRLRVAGTVPGPVEGGGRAAGYFTGATGVTIYRGDAWPSNWRGHAIIGDVGSNLIHRKRLDPDGLEFVARRIDQQSEFVTSKDIWFRPAQFASAPDGSLLAIDVCREVIEHPKSLPPEIKKHLDLTAGRDRGRIYRIASEGFRYRPTPQLAAADSIELVQLLGHDNAWHRETAARLLFERQDQAVQPALYRLAAEGPPLGRLHAMYTLHGMSALSAGMLRDRLADEHPQVRRHAVRLCEQLADSDVEVSRPDSKALFAALAKLVDDPSIEVRCQLAYTIGSIDLPDSDRLLASLVRRDVGDRWVRAAVQSSLGDGAGNLFSLLLADSTFRSAAAADFLKSLAHQLSVQNQRVETMAAVESLSRLPESDASFALPLMGELLQGRKRKGSALAELFGAGKLAGLEASIDSMLDSLCDIAADPGKPLSNRMEAASALALGDFELVSPTLIGLIDPRQPQPLQQAAISTLGKLDTPGVARPLIDAWQELSPGSRQIAEEALFARPDRALALFDAVDSGSLPRSSLTTARLKIAAKSKNANLRKRSLAYLDADTTGARAEVVSRYRRALDLDGDIENGRKLFQKQCSVCHRVEGVGFEIGPNLSAIKTRGQETILVNVLDPNREVNPQYLNYIALTLDGRSVTGMIAAENSTALTLRRAENASDTILRVDLDRLQSSGMSIMPEGMEDSIDVQGMADVIAYLMQVK